MLKGRGERKGTGEPPVSVQSLWFSQQSSIPRWKPGGPFFPHLPHKLWHWTQPDHILPAIQLALTLPDETPFHSLMTESPASLPVSLAPLLQQRCGPDV